MSEFASGITFGAAVVILFVLLGVDALDVAAVLVLASPLEFAVRRARGRRADR